MHNINEIWFIKVFFRILLSFFLLIGICMATFYINDSVAFKTGEIIAEVPQLDYKAPFEAIPHKIFVREGQQVKAGDTLMIIINEQIRKDYQDAEATYASLQINNETIAELIESTYARIENLKRERSLNTKVHQSQKNKLRTEFKSAEQKADMNREKLVRVALTKLKMDSALFRQNVISKLDITNSYDNYANYKNSLIESELTRDQIQSNSTNLDNEYLRTQNSLDRKLLELGERIKELEIQKSESDKLLKSAIDNLNFFTQEIHKQFLISSVDGEVLNLYNLRYSLNFINKGDIILSVAPKRDKFYAKVVIPQRDIRYVRVGQKAHLKVDAFHFFDKGVLKGEVSYVPERKPKEDFFVVIDLPADEKFRLKAGYSLKGEIIVERLKIYKFIAKKLFRKLESEPESPGPGGAGTETAKGNASM